MRRSRFAQYRSKYTNQSSDRERKSSQICEGMWPCVLTTRLMYDLTFSPHHPRQTSSGDWYLVRLARYCLPVYKHTLQEARSGKGLLMLMHFHNNNNNCCPRSNHRPAEHDVAIGAEVAWFYVQGGVTLRQRTQGCETSSTFRASQFRVYKRACSAAWLASFQHTHTIVTIERKLGFHQHNANETGGV